MATEGPLVHDGSQCSANANYYNPGVALAGVAGSGQFLAVVLSASRVVSIASNATTPVYGILQNTPLATDPADVGISGISKAVAGATIAFGQEVMSGTDGRLIPYVIGASTNFKCGLAIEAAVANQVFSMMIYNPSVKGNAA